MHVHFVFSLVFCAFFPSQTLARKGAVSCHFSQVWWQIQQKFTPVAALFLGHTEHTGQEHCRQDGSYWLGGNTSLGSHGTNNPNTQAHKHNLLNKWQKTKQNDSKGLGGNGRTCVWNRRMHAYVCAHVRVYVIFAICYKRKKSLQTTVSQVRNSENV